MKDEWWRLKVEGLRLEGLGGGGCLMTWEVANKWLSTLSIWFMKLRYAFKKKIAYNETFSYLGGRGSKKNLIILHLINGTFIMGRRGSKFFVSCLILKKICPKGEVEGFQTKCSMWLRHLIIINYWWKAYLMYLLENTTKGRLMNNYLLTSRKSWSCPIYTREGGG